MFGNGIQFIGDLISQNMAYFACYFCAGIIGLFIAIIELLSKYGAGNNPNWILFGNPQVIYYLTNFSAGALVLFSSETLNKSSIISTFATNPSLAILQSALLGISAMFLLRSSLFSVNPQSNKPKVDLGPAQILNIINQYLDSQIDKRRSVYALEEICKLMEKVDPEIIYPDLLICLIARESISKDDAQKIREELESLMSPKNKMNKTAKAIAIGLVVQKELGVNALKIVVEFLKSAQVVEKLETNIEDGKSKTNTSQEDEVRLKSVDDALAENLGKLLK